MKSVVVTGGAGYIGSLLVHSLLNDGNHVEVIDNLSVGGESLLNVWNHPNFKFHRGDIREDRFVEGFFKNGNHDAVVHLAAIVGDPACAKDPQLANETNWTGSLNILNAAMNHNVERFVFASTCSNYGKMANPNDYVDEDSTLAPVSLYAELKVKLEKYILNKIQRSDSFCPTILRFATVYGASPRMRFDLTVNEFTKDLAMNKTLKVFGEEFWRPYCHVSDFARAIKCVLDSDKDKVAFNVFNVGDTNENYQKKSIVELIRSELPSSNVEYVKKDEDPRDYRVSFAKIEKELGFGISKKVIDGIREVVYLVKNKVILNPDDPKYRNS